MCLTPPLFKMGSSPQKETVPKHVSVSARWSGMRLSLQWDYHGSSCEELFLQVSCPWCWAFPRTSELKYPQDRVNQRSICQSSHWWRACGRHSSDIVTAMSCNLSKVQNTLSRSRRHFSDTWDDNVQSLTRGLLSSGVDTLSSALDDSLSNLQRKHRFLCD